VLEETLAKSAISHFQTNGRRTGLDHFDLSKAQPVK